MSVSTVSDALLVGADLPDFTELVSGPQAVLQRIWLRLSIHRGEWFADPSVGMPWNFWMTRPMSQGLAALIAQAVRAEVADTPGVERVLSVLPEFDIDKRSITITFEAELERETLEVAFRVDPRLYGNTSPHITRRLTRSRAIYGGF